MNISIIGGGATGCAILIALLREMKESLSDRKISITIFEPNQLGRGIAYGDYDSNFQLNTSVCSSSIIHTDNQDFLKWLDASKDVWQKFYPEVKRYDRDTFLPRSLIGLYIQDRIKKEIASLEKSLIQVNHINERVTNIHFHKNDLISIITNKANYLSYYCIIATGYVDGLPKTYQHLMESPHYYPSPYFCIKEIKKIPHDKRILILGTRLTGIDIVKELKDYKHLVMASRSGFLPAVRNKLCFTPPKYLTKVHIENFFQTYQNTCTLELVKKEIEQELSLIYNQSIIIDQLYVRDDPVRQLEEDIYLAKNHLNFWEDSIMGFVYFINKAWLYLSLHDKKNLLKNEMNIIHRYISAFPYQNAKLIACLLKKGHLSLRKGIKHIDIEGEGFNVCFCDHKSESQETFDYIINATPIDNNVLHSTQKLYKDMISEGIITINHFGGIKVNDNLQILSSGIYKQKFYAAGPIIKGSLLVTNFLRSSAEQAYKISHLICKNIMNNRTQS